MAGHIKLKKIFNKKIAAQVKSALTIEHQSEILIDVNINLVEKLTLGSKNLKNCKRQSLKSKVLLTWLQNRTENNRIQSESRPK